MLNSSVHYELTPANILRIEMLIIMKASSRLKKSSMLMVLGLIWPNVLLVYSLYCWRSVEFGDGQAAADLDGVDGVQRHHAVVKVEELMTVYKHEETRMLTVDLNPEGLLCDEGEIRYRSLLVTPLVRHTGVSQDLPILKPHTHIKSHISTAACQTDVKTVRICAHNTHDGDLLARSQTSTDPSTERHGQFLLISLW